MAQLSGNDEDNVINGTDDDDRVLARGGDDIISGFKGEDHIYGMDGDDLIYGHEDHDELSGGDGNDILFGGSGYDELYGGIGNDELYGGTGNDTISDFQGDNIIDGGEGFDTFRYLSKREDYSLIENGDTVIVTVIGIDAEFHGNPIYGTNTFTNVERIRFDDVFWEKSEPCPTDTGLYTVSGSWAHDDIKNICETKSNLSLSYKTGAAGLKINTSGASKHDDKTLNAAEGVIFATISGKTTQLFTSKADINFSGGAFTVEDEKNNTGDITLAGLDLKFANLNILDDSVRGQVSFVLPESLTGPDNLITVDGKGAVVIVDKLGVSLGLDVKLDIPDKEFSFFKYFDVSATDQSISYIALDDAIRLQGKYEVKSFIRDIGFDKIELDLSDKNFIQIKDGKADFKGSVSATKDVGWNPYGWSISKLQIDFDTIAHTVGGTIGVKFPFNGDMAEMIGTMEFVTSPVFELNAIGLKLDGLGIPVGNSGLFLSSINGKLYNMAPSAKKDTAFTGGLEFDAGPVFKGKSIAHITMQGTLDGTKIIGEASLKAIDDKVMKVNGKVELDWREGTTQIEGDFNLVDGFFTAKTVIKANSNFDFSMDGEGKVNVPNFIAGIGGQNLSNAFYRVSFTADDNYANDFAAGWTEKSYSNFGLTVKFVLGAKYSFDEKWSLFGLNNIPQIVTTPTTAKIAKVAEAGEAPEWMLLLANWENSNSSVTLRVIDPNGKIINQADFAANKIEILNDLSSNFAKTVMVVNPLKGNYKIEIVNTTGLGETKFSSAVETASPTLTITSPKTDVANPSKITINYDAFDSDSDANLALYYDTDKDGANGILFKNGITEVDGSGSYEWDLSDIGTGEYYIYGVLSDGINPGVINYATGKIDVEANKTLSDTLGNVTLKGGNFHDKLIALSGLNNLDGAKDSDFILGGLAADTLKGGIGNDIIRGDASDIIGGSDHIIAGKGNDLLMGGKGADIFTFTTNEDANIIAQFKTDKVSFDSNLGYSATPTEADFQSGIDHIELLNFTTVNATNVMDFINDNGDSAVFVAEDTAITFYDLQTSQLSANDFMFA